MPDTKKTIEVQGPAGRIVIPEKEKQDYLLRGYKVVESRPAATGKSKVTTKKDRS